MGKKRDVVDGVGAIHESPVLDGGELTPVEMACAAYGIEPKYLLGSRMDGESVILVTVGGSKVVWTPGAPITPLTRVQITGINPANANRKPITGGKR